MKLHNVTYPNEPTEYRTKRNEILKAEIEFRREMERIAEKRRKLPLGGPVPTDYIFDTEKGRLRMSQMFTGNKDTLVIYSFMYGPKMEEPCPL